MTTDETQIERCEFCNGLIRPADEVCPLCGKSTIIDATLTADAAPPVQQTQTEDERLKNPWILAIVMLHLGVLGIPLYWKTRYSRGTRVLLVIASIAYTIFAVSVIAWGIGQLIRGGRSLFGL